MHEDHNTTISTQFNSLLGMPTELRLIVYQYLFLYCLAEGSVSDVAGLLLTCREVLQEVETEYIIKLRPLLQAKYAWEATPGYKRQACSRSTFIQITKPKGTPSLYRFSVSVTRSDPMKNIPTSKIYYEAYSQFSPRLSRS